MEGIAIMENNFFRILSIISLSVLVMFSCEDETKDVEDTVVPTPVITSISPAEGYPGEEVTITGENFNATTSSNLIEIDTNDVSLASITPSAGTTTSLTFTRPNVSGVGVSITANLRVRNVEDPDEKVSDSESITLLPIFDIITVAGLPKTKGGLAFDADGNVYARGQDPGEVYKITPEGEESYFGQTHWGEGEMHIGPDGYLYAAVVWGDYGIVRIPPTGGDYETYMPADIYVDNPFDFDWDSDGNMYIGTADGTIYRRSATTDEVSLLKPSGSWGSPMRLFGDDLYWYVKGADMPAENGLFKAPVPAEGDTITASSVTQILASGDYTPSGLAIDGMGNIYLMDGWIDKDDTTGTITQQLVRVTPAGAVENVYELPTQNPNKAIWHEDKIYVAAGNQGNKIYVIYLGPDYGTGAVPQNTW